jgi:hypothetical protein
MLKNPAKYERDILSEKFTAISHQLSSDLLLGVSVGTHQRVLVDESGMIRIHMGIRMRSENGHSAWGALHDTTS